MVSADEEAPKRRLRSPKRGRFDDRDLVPQKAPLGLRKKMPPGEAAMEGITMSEKTVPAGAENQKEPLPAQPLPPAETPPEPAPPPEPQKKEKKGKKKKGGQADSNQPARNKFADKKKRRLPKWIKIVVFLLILAAIGYGVYTLLQRLTTQEETDNLQVGMAIRGPLAQNVTGYGVIRPQQEAKYGDKTRGEVVEVAVEAGQTVHAGDLLFVVDPSEFQEELDEAYDAVESARQRVEEAQRAIDDLTFTAPFSGKLIDAPTFRQGQEVAAGASLGKLVDDSTLKLASYYSYAYENEIHPGMAVRVSIPDSMAEVEGVVDSVDYIRKIQDGAVLFRANISIPNTGTLSAGVYAAAAIPTEAGDIMPADSGKLENAREEEISLKAGGTVAYSSVMDYGEYTQGQTLVTLTSTTTGPALDNARKSYDAAVKRVSELEKDMQNTEIRSEIDGMISSVVVKVGDKLTASGTPVITVSDTSSLVVEANIDELDMSKIAVGMPVEVTTGDSSDPENVPTIGTLVELSYEAKSDSNEMGGAAYFPVKIAIDSDGRLLPNMNVNYKINTTLLDDCLQIPSSAVIYTEAGVTAFVRPAEGATYENIAEDVPADQIPEGFIAVSIEIGIADERNTQVLSGLNEGDEVYMTSVSQEDMYGEAMVGAAFPAARLFRR